MESLSIMTPLRVPVQHRCIFHLSDLQIAWADPEQK